MEKKFEVGNIIVVILPKYGNDNWFKITGRTKKQLEVVDLSWRFEYVESYGLYDEDIYNIDEKYIAENKAYVNVISFTDKTNGDIIEGVSVYSLTKRFKDHCKKGRYVLAIPGNIPNCPEAYNLCFKV